jgi:NADH:ubiquinone oxidoreductase subunit 6 (subunit J)
MPKQYDLLSLGVLLFIVAVVLVLLGARLLTELEVLALVVAFYGVWTMVLAGIRIKNPEKYGRGAYSTLVWGIILTALGGAWFLNLKGTNIIFTIALLLVVIGILAVASALPSIRQK